MNNTYEFRKLQAEDTFLMFSILSKIGIDKFSECFEKESVNKLVTSLVNKKELKTSGAMVGVSVALEIANIIMANSAKCKDDLYQLLANTSNLEVEDIKNLSLPTFAKMIIDFVKKEEFKDFFKVVLESFKPEK